MRHLLFYLLMALLAGGGDLAMSYGAGTKTISPAGEEGPQTHLMVASDLHYLSPSLTDHGSCFTELVRNGDGKVMEYSQELVEAFVDTVLEKKPDALILTGDLTFNGARKSHEDLAEKLGRIEEAGIPVAVLSGNHDLWNKNAASFSGDRVTFEESVSAKEFKEIYFPFGFEEACAQDETSSSYIWEPAAGLRIVMLDVNGVAQACSVSEDTLKWLEDQLKEGQEAGDRMIAFSHQNLMWHSMFADGYMIENSREVFDLYQKYGVAANFSGHLHIQRIGELDGFYEVVTSALSVSPLHYGEIAVKGKVLDYSTESVDVSAWAGKNGRTEKELLEFGEYARRFFLDTFYRQAEEKLAGVKDEEQKDRMADYFAWQNYRYFSGCPAGPGDEKLLRAWKGSETFFGMYLEGIAGEEKDQNRITVEFR